MPTRHCAKCKNPWTECGNKDCRCHADTDTDAEVIGLLDYLKGKG